MSQVSNETRFEELLVPYVQNRLNTSERQFVEELAKSDRELNEKLQFEIQLANHVQQSKSEFKEIMPSFHELKQQIEVSNRSDNWWNIFSRNSESSLHGFNPSLVLASLAVICVGIYMLFLQDRNQFLEDNYETLSSDETKIAYQHDRNYFRVIIATGITKPEIQIISDKFVFDIEFGPDSLNSYVISLAKDDSRSTDALQRLRDDSRFLMIEPLAQTSTEN